MNAEPPATDYIRKGNLPSGIGGFRYWTGSFKDAIRQSKDGAAGSPFSNVRTYDIEYQNTENYGDDARAFLNDNDGFSDSSYISFKLKSGWQGLFYIRTENNDFWEDNALNDVVSDDWNGSDSFTEELREATDLMNEAGYPTIWVQNNAELSDSRAIVALDGNNGDYISFDIDSESDNVAQARVRLDGDDYVSNKEIDNEVFITMIWLRKWDSSLNMGGETSPSPDPDTDPDTDPDPEPQPGVECPVGFKDNGFGICVPIEPDPDTDPDTDPEPSPEDDVSGFEVLLLLGALAGSVILAVRL